MEEKKDEQLSPIRTYKGDVEGLIKSGDGSFTKIAIAENDRKNAELIADEPPEHDHTRLILIISIIFILVGSGALYYIYQYRNIILPQKAVTPISEQGMISTEGEKNVNVGGLNRNKLVELLATEIKSQTGKQGSIVDLKLVGEDGAKITSSKLFTTLEAQMPSGLSRSLDDKFMFGVQLLNKNEPFLILKTNYYQGAYAGMLEWEKNIKEDLGNIFFIKEDQVVATTSENILRKSKDFEDVVYKNRDTRALRDNNKKITFIYSFLDRSTIILATNPETLDQVISRLLTKKLVQ